MYEINWQFRSKQNKRMNTHYRNIGGMTWAHREFTPKKQHRSVYKEENTEKSASCVTVFCTFIEKSID